MKALYLLLVGLALFAASPANAQCAVDIFGLVSGCPPATVTTPTPPPSPCGADPLCGPTGQAPEQRLIRLTGRHWQLSAANNLHD